MAYITSRPSGSPPLDGCTAARPTEPPDRCLAAWCDADYDYDSSAERDDATFASTSEPAGHNASREPKPGDAAAFSEPDRREPSAERDHTTLPDASEPDDGHRTSSHSKSGYPCASSDDNSSAEPDCYHRPHGSYA